MTDLERHQPDVEMAWVNREEPRLEKQYPGKWLAVKGEEIIAVAGGAKEALVAARAKGVEHPLLVAMRAEDYQDVIIIRGFSIK